ncbi:MAG: signal peptidase II [Proteobacteria bacterium]|nr:signal peptidase II [Pseudomonadota bacterium]
MTEKTGINPPHKYPNEALIWSLFLGSFLPILILDQCMKIKVLELLKKGFFKEPITSFFNIVERWNRGISFGMLGEQNLSPYVFVFLTGIICLFLFVWFLKEKTPLMAVSLGLIIGGALSNAYDRLTIGAVFDFLEFHISRYYWPAFNLADSTIVLGVGLLFLKSLIKTKQE